tara:strand:+ start:165 stop:617 length:453 start_codon:yes stop_codon:yes gene_type:complete
MELILKNDVQNLGFKDDIVIVKNGYGRNFLIPNGLAILATNSAKKVLAENIKQREFKEKKIVDEAKKVSKKLEKIEVKLSAKAGKAGKLFGSVSNANLADELNNIGFEFDKKIISVKGGLIKKLGSYTASIRLHRDVVSEISFEVVKLKE